MRTNRTHPTVSAVSHSTSAGSEPQYGFHGSHHNASAQSGYENGHITYIEPIDHVSSTGD